jgi:nucleotide-binding universal stress UspA family protein
VTSLKDILVHVDTTPHGAARLSLAAGLAAAPGAQLGGLGLADTPSSDPFRANMIVPLPGGSEQLVQAMREQSVSALAPFEAAFREHLQQVERSGAWRLTEGHPAALMTAQARYADLAVMCQPSRYVAHDSFIDAMTASVLMRAGRPILMAPCAGDVSTIGQRVLVA